MPLMVTGAFPTPADTQDYIQILTGPSDDNSLRDNNETNVVTFNVARGTARQAATNFTPVIPAIPASFQTGLHSSNVTSLPINTRAPRKIAVPPHGEACWPTRNPSTTDFLMARRQSSRGALPDFSRCPQHLTPTLIHFQHGGKILQQQQIIVVLFLEYQETFSVLPNVE